MMNEVDVTVMTLPQLILGVTVALENAARDQDKNERNITF